MNEELKQIIEMEREKQNAVLRNDNIKYLTDYDVTSITKPSDSNTCYDVVLTPQPRPVVRLRIRKQDLSALVAAMNECEREKCGWRLDMDKGSILTSAGTSGVRKLISADIDGKGLCFYGVREEQK